MDRITTTLRKTIIAPSGHTRYVCTGTTRHRLRATALLLGLIFTLAVPLADGGPRAECIDYGDYLHWQGYVDLLGVDCDFHNIGTSATHACIPTYIFGSDMHLHYFVQIIDTSDPNEPRMCGYIETYGRNRDMVISGHHAYVASYRHLVIVDFSDPENPVIRGSRYLPDGANGVAISGDLVYITYGGESSLSGLAIIDVSIPNQPEMISDLALPEFAWDVEISGDIAVVLAGESSLHVIDISDPASPAVLGTLGTLGGTLGMAIVDTHAYVAAAETGLQVVSLADPASPQLIATLPLQDRAMQVKADCDHAYVADFDGGLQIVDISDPSQPVVESYTDWGMEAIAIGLQDSNVYFISLYAFYSYDVSSCALPPMLGGEEVSGGILDLAMVDDYMFAACGPGLQVYDLTEPENPDHVVTLDLTDIGYKLKVIGDHAFVAANNAGLQVVDISDPLVPLVVGNLPGDWIRFMDAEGALACIMDGNTSDMFKTVDISDPTNPQIVAELDLPGSPNDVVLRGSLAYVATGDGLFTIDVSDPADPQILDHLELWIHKRIAVDGDYAYTTGLELNVIDISDPENLQLAGSCSQPHDITHEIEINGSHLYIGDIFYAMFIYDISDPIHPVIIGGIENPTYARSLLPTDDYLYLGRSGLGVAPAQCAPTSVGETGRGTSGTTSLSCYPNPSRGASNLRFELFSRGLIQVAIYSVDGRLIRRLVDAPLGPGTHELIWDGRDDGNRRVPAGVYLSRVSTPEGVKRGRLVLLR